MTNKEKYSWIFKLFLLFPLLEPDSFRTIHSFHMFLRSWAFAAIFIMLLMYLVRIKNKERPSFSIIVMAVYSVWLLYVSTLSIGNFQTTLTQVISILGISMWGDLFCDDNRSVLLLTRLIMLYIYINLFTLICFPNGLYQSQSYQAIPYICFFLGYRNVQSLWLIPALSLVLWENYSYNKIMTKRTMIRIIVIVLTIIMLRSSTTYVASVSFVLVYFGLKLLNKKKKIGKGIDLTTLYIGSIIISVLIIFYGFQYKFSFLIENILHKDMDLSDRIYLWKNVIVYTSQRPWTGYGYIYDATSRALVGGSHAHNYVLNLMYTGGIIGVVLVSLIWLSASYNSKRCLNRRKTLMLISGCVAMLIIGFTEPLKQLPTVYILLFILNHEKDSVTEKGKIE